MLLFRQKEFLSILVCFCAFSWGNFIRIKLIISQPIMAFYLLGNIFYELHYRLHIYKWRAFKLMFRLWFMKLCVCTHIYIYITYMCICMCVYMCVRCYTHCRFYCNLSISSFNMFGNTSLSTITYVFLSFTLLGEN